ncbi:4839_t:CDS:2 [Ambispora leptoticha]|uniref:4839_t:CDS:1 n=1 Tax=Ambispora leptoticha TaxID=144679 RepID=A0A9N9C7Q5_9GLOM|nr:4839_t:CDS:2 [Ambispora leptoticha]
MNSFLKIIVLIIINLSILISQCNSIDTASLPREGNEAVLVGNKIYYIGGRTASPRNFNTFLLDLSSDFSATDPNFVQVSGLEYMPLPTWTSACLGEDNIIYIFGGTDASQPSLPEANTLYEIKSLNDTSLSWTTSSPKQGDTWPSARDGIFPIIDNLSRIFVWGGRNTGQDNTTTYIFESNSWKGHKLANTPNPRSSYSATLLNDGRIIYIGGTSRSPYPDVNILETSTSSEEIKNRVGHSALLHSDSISIIVYGGCYQSNEDITNSDYNEYSAVEIPDSDSVWILNTKTWTWSRPSVPSLSYITVTRGHTAVMYNGYMIIAFGVYGHYSFTSQVKVMDVRNLNSLAWVPTYKVANGHKLNLGLILGICGAIAGALAIFALVIFFIRRRKSLEYVTHSNNEPVSEIIATVKSRVIPAQVQDNFSIPEYNPS